MPQTVLKLIVQNCIINCQAEIEILVFVPVCNKVHDDEDIKNM